MNWKEKNYFFYNKRRKRSESYHKNYYYDDYYKEKRKKHNYNEIERANNWDDKEKHYIIHLGENLTSRCIYI
jgi:aspartyl aminopeptidase